MAKKDDAKDSEPELDEDGIQIQTYLSQVLVVVPAKGFGEQALRYARSSLHNIHVGTRSVSTEYDEMVKGRLQDEFLVDQPLSGIRLDDYSGVLFAGGEGAPEMAENPEVQRLAREAAQQGKLVAAWGEALAVLIRAGVVKGRKVTGARGLKDEAKRAGAKYSTRQVVTDRNFVTGLDESAGLRFGRALAAAVDI